MRRIVFVAGLLASLGVAGCDQPQPTAQNAPPVAQLPPPPPPVLQPTQQIAPSSPTRHRRVSRSDDSFYGEDSESYSDSEQDSYDDEDNSSDRATVETRERHKRAVAHLWTDGYGRQHFSTSGEQDFYAERAANDPINTKDYRDPWFGYDEHCKNWR